jgi:hypothetical protein
MRLAFHQPNYLPNLSFFYKMASVDVFVITTNIQFVRREWQSRAKLKGAGDADLLLTVPVLGSSRQSIREALINNSEPWRHKHAATIRNVYGKSVERAFLTRLLEAYERPSDRLVDLNMTLIHIIRDALGIVTPLILDEEVAGHRHELLAGLCRKYQADTYLSGLGGKLYMDDDYRGACEAAGIAIEFVSRNITGEHPYSAIHYILGQGVPAAKRIVLDDVNGAAIGALGLTSAQVA